MRPRAEHNQVSPRLPAVAVALVLLLSTATPSFGHGDEAFEAGQKGFHSVLAYGQGQSANAVDLARNQADGTVPPSFTSQGDLYDKVITEQPTGDDLSSYYKDSSFAEITGDTVTLDGAKIVRDAAHKVPRIYGETRAAAMFATGYATAQDRLFLMDVLRRTALGSTSELLGPSAVPADAATLGQFDLSPEELEAEVMRLPEDEGEAGSRGLRDLQQYVAGINAWIAKTRLDPTLLPAEYPALGATPRDWTLADTAAEAYLLIAQFTVFGDGEHLQSDVLSRLQTKLGATKGKAVYDDLRHLEDPDAPVTADRPFPSDRPAPGASSAVPLDAGSITPRNAVVSQSPGVAGAFPAWAEKLATEGLQLKHEASNALLVTAANSASGRALAAMGPQVGYYSPEILVEYEVHAPGIHASGMSFPGASPFPLIGHTGEVSWSGTTANGDNADTFAEELCDPAGGPVTKDTDHYLYKGACIAFTHRDQVLQTPVAPTSPEPPQTVRLRTMRSVHGPVHDFATSGGKTFALVRSTAVNQHGIRSLVAFLRLAEGQVHTPQEFVETMRDYTGNENWFFVSSEHIAWIQSGWFPQHAPGTDLELPIKGTGQWDWKGFDPATSNFTRQPDSFNPTAIDPAQGYLASWNNKGAKQWRAAPGIWSYGRVHRDQLLRDPTVEALKAGRKLTLADVVAISGNASTQDLRGVAVLPDLLDTVGADAEHAEALTALRAWVANGAHRRDTSADGFYEDSTAVLAFDAWWRQLVHDIYDPQLDASVVTLLQGPMNLVLDGRPVQSGFYDGWYGQVSDVVRAALGKSAKPSGLTTQCGDGTLAGCRALLRTALGKALETVAATEGTDLGAWKKPALCPDDDTPTCDENRPITAGAIATPAHPFQNRGTYHQAVEVLGPLTPGRPTRPTRPAPAANGGLAATGGAPLLAVLGLLLLGGAYTVRVRSARPR